jgi:DSF synthase
MGASDARTEIPQPKISECLAVEFDRRASNSLWITMARAPHGGCQNFSLPLLQGLRDLLFPLKENAIHWQCDGQLLPIHYTVLRSAHPDQFSLGGDLKHFRSCIQRKDRAALYDYARLCLNILYELATSVNRHATTIALVQGRALGGGFEAALSADFLIAEDHSEFGFPEILFGLFPGTGGMSLLARRIGVHEAERMMTCGRVYPAAELKELGIVDVLCPRGEGPVAVQRFIADHARHRAARLMLQRSRYRVAPLDYQELVTVAEEWVETAMVLSDADLRAMDVLIRMQAARGTAAPSHETPHCIVP